MLDCPLSFRPAKAEPGRAGHQHTVPALESTSGLVGIHTIFNLEPDDHNGNDRCTRVLVKGENGKRILVR